MVLMYLKNVYISSVGPRIFIPKPKKYHLRLRTVHACSWGRSVKAFCTTNLQAIEPKAACPVIELPFLLWIYLSESCLATCDFSRYLTLPFAFCREEKTLGQQQSPVWVGAADSSVCDGLQQAWAHPEPQQPCRLTAVQAHWLCPKALQT